MYRRSPKLIAISFASIIVIGIAWWISLRYLNFDSIKKQTLLIQTTAQNHIYVAAAGLFLIHLLGMLFTLPIKAIFNIVSGALLGVVAGTAITILGTLIGTTGLFFFSKKILRESASTRLPAKLKKFESKLKTHPTITVASLRLILALPYGAITMFSAATNIKYRPFIIGSFLGDIPIVLMYSSAGLKLADLVSAKEALSLTSVVILTLAGIGLFAGVLWPSRNNHKM